MSNISYSIHEADEASHYREPVPGSDPEDNLTRGKLICRVNMDGVSAGGVLEDPNDVIRTALEAMADSAAASAADRAEADAAKVRAMSNARVSR